jgi:hypothetical protein
MRNRADTCLDHLEWHLNFTIRHLSRKFRLYQSRSQIELPRRMYNSRPVGRDYVPDVLLAS